MSRVVLSLAVLVAVGCARQPEPETRLEREIRNTERALARMQNEMDSLSQVRRGLDARIAALGIRRPATDTVVVAASTENAPAPAPAGEPAMTPVPGGGEAALSEAEMTRMTEVVLFATNSAQLSAAAKSLLSAKADILRQHEGLSLSLVGHADARGKADYNQKLSERRAESVRKFLASQGIDASRLTAEGRGENEPKVQGEGAEVWRQNRRVEFVIQ